MIITLLSVIWMLSTSVVYLTRATFSNQTFFSSFYLTPACWCYLIFALTKRWSVLIFRSIDIYVQIFFIRIYPGVVRHNIWFWQWNKKIFPIKVHLYRTINLTKDSFDPTQWSIIRYYNNIIPFLSIKRSQTKEHA